MSRNKQRPPFRLGCFAVWNRRGAAERCRLLETLGHPPRWRHAGRRAWNVSSLSGTELLKPNVCFSLGEDRLTCAESTENLLAEEATGGGNARDRSTMMTREWEGAVGVRFEVFAACCRRKKPQGMDRWCEGSTVSNLYEGYLSGLESCFYSRSK